MFFNTTYNDVSCSICLLLWLTSLSSLFDLACKQMMVKPGRFLFTKVLSVWKILHTLCTECPQSLLAWDCEPACNALQGRKYFVKTFSEHGSGVVWHPPSAPHLNHMWSLVNSTWQELKTLKQLSGLHGRDPERRTYRNISVSVGRGRQHQSQGLAHAEPGVAMVLAPS